MTVCAACGHVNQHAAKFCSECGVALEAEATTALEERKYVTVLFADLVDFTSRAERMDPEDVRALLSPYYARLRSELEHFGGTVEKFIGDAVMALFGAPTAHDDDPERAVRAAIAIRDWLVEDGQLQVRIGVNTGEVLVTLAARSAEGEGMAAGDVINTAARLQAAAPPNGILVGAGTHRATRNAVEYRSGASVRAKGKENPVPAWEAVRARSRFGVDVPHEAKSELIGRDGELRMLAEALARVRRERSTQLVTIVGVPGMGKSRLLYELSRIVDSESDLIAWRQGRSLPYGEGVSLWALVEMVKAQAGILESDAAAEAEAKLAAMVADVLTEPGELEWVRRHLNVLLGFGEDVGSATGDRRSEAFAGYRRLFEALADARPLVAVFEDLHWADDGLLDFVDHLIDWAGDVPLLVVCSARPELFERRPGWGGGKSNAVTISLSPLSDNDTARLIGSLMGRPVVEAELQQQLLSRAGGNPLFTEQFVQMQAEQANAGALSLPDSVQGIVSARLDALAAPDKQLLQDAAVIGKVFWPSAVAALAGAGDRGSLEEALHRLERKQFVRRERQSSIGTQTQYAFQHILLRDVAYGQIPRSVRAGKHALAARWIQSLGRPDEYAEMLAHHFMSALEFARAAGQHTAALASDARGAIIEAAERASALNAHPSAVRFYREALALSPDVPRKSHADLLFGLALATLRAGEDEPDAAFEAARTALLAIDDRPRAAVLDAEMSRVWWERGDGDRSAEHGARAHDLVRDEPATPEKAVVLASLARHLMLAGNLDTSLADEALALSGSLGLAEVHADVLVTLGTAHGFAKDPNGPIEIRRALDAALAGNFLATAIRAYSNLAVLAERDGDLREGADAGRQAEAVAQRLGSWSALRWTRGNRVGSLLVVGEWDECARLADEAISQSETLGPHYLDAQAYFARALLSIARERIDAALVNQVAGLASARRAQDPQVLYSTLASSAYVLAEAGHLDESRALLDELLHTANADKADMFAYAGPEVALTAETIGRREELRLWLGPALGSAWTQAARAILADDFAQALSLIEPMGAIFTASVIRLRAGKHLIQQGQRDEAQAMLQPAITFFKSVGATHYLRTAQALLAA